MCFDPLVPGKKHQKKGRLGKRVASCCYLTQIAAAFDYTFEFILDSVQVLSFRFQIWYALFFQFFNNQAFYEQIKFLKKIPSVNLFMN